MSPSPPFPDLPGQRGLATTRQLRDAGLTRSAITHGLDRRWQQPMPGVVAPHRGPLHGDDRLAAAALWAGPGAVLTGGVALARHGLVGADREEAVFLVPGTSRARAHGPVRTVRTTREVRVAKELGCVLVAGLDRALLDAAQHQDMTHRDLTALALSALQQGRTHPDRLHQELRATPRLTNAPLVAALETFDRRAWSLPEGEFDRLLATCSELPPRLLNPRLTDLAGRLIGTPDAFFAEAGVAAQVHSRQHHSGYDDDGTDLWSMTVEKDGAYAEHSVIVVGVTPRSIARRPAQVLERVRTVVLRNRGRSYGPVLVDGQMHGRPARGDEAARPP